MKVFLHFYQHESNDNPDDVDGEYTTTIVETESCPDQKRECTRKNRTTIEIVCKRGFKDRCSYETIKERCQIDETFCKGRLFKMLFFQLL